MKITLFYFAVLIAIVLMGCTRREADPVLSRGLSATSAPAQIEPDKWLGQWRGPEGTFLTIAGASGKYQITIQNLDGPGKFEGVAVGNSIEFARDGITETIRSSNGSATGMKWLANKSDCLTIRLGEGYCKD